MKADWKKRIEIKPDVMGGKPCMALQRKQIRLLKRRSNQRRRNMKKVTYEEHIKELLKKKAVREEFEKLLPEYELAKSIIEQRLRKMAEESEGEHVRGLTYLFWPS